MKRVRAIAGFFNPLLCVVIFFSIFFFADGGQYAPTDTVFALQDGLDRLTQVQNDEFCIEAAGFYIENDGFRI